MQPASHLYSPISNRRLYDHVVQQVARQIISGALAPGTALPTEPELAQQFAVSRTVIREAMRVLVSKGLLTVKHGSGMWVQPADRWDHLDPLVLFEQIHAGQDDGVFDEAIEVRRLLELDAAALAAERRTAEDLRSMRASLDGMAAAIADPDEYTRFDVEFHEAILAAARNRLLREALRPIAAVLKAGRLVSIRQPGAPEKSLHGHDEIYAAIKQQDPEEARAAMERHVTQFETDIRAARDRGLGLKDYAE
jgi:DNA-binding FadR family transcriptional regulator